MKHGKGFTLIELLIVIAIILILIAIALPNFLEAQLRAKVARVKGDIRGLQTAIEAFRTERGVLLIDFWDDGTPAAFRRWESKLSRVGKQPGPTNSQAHTYDLFEESYFPLTSPAAYLKIIALDPFNDPDRRVGFFSDEHGAGYIYFDNDDWRGPDVRGNLGRDDHGVDVFESDENGLGRFGIQPLREGEFGMFSVGPDREAGTRLTARNANLVGLPYSPTNGTNSTGDIVSRSNGSL